MKRYGYLARVKMTAWSGMEVPVRAWSSDSLTASSEKS